MSMRGADVRIRIDHQICFFLFYIFISFLPAQLHAKTIHLTDENRSSVNEVVFWNHLALEFIKKNNIPPPRASRLLGLLHVSIFDAINFSNPHYQPYFVDLSKLRGQTANTFAAQAAAYVLRSEFPDETTFIDTKLLERAPDYSEITGELVAKEVLDNHPLNFGTLETPTVINGFQWVPTPPQFASFLLPKWCTITPLGIRSPKDFRKSGPPDPESDEFQQAMDEVRLLGENFSHDRTADQTQIALFWADGKGTVTPPGHWNQIATDLIQASRMSLLDSARVMALLNLAMADAAIVAWDMKYMFQFPRPVTMFSQNSWEPLIATPPFPEYVSGHSTFSGAAATVLTAEFGQMSFVTKSDAMPGVTRRYYSFTQAAEEAGRSRIYGGIHFSFSDRDGRQAGTEVAQYILTNHLQKIIP